MITENKPKTTIDFEFYKSYENVPIDELADHLGLKTDCRGKYTCPCHNDTHPSMIITKSGKYENRFHCYACNEGGDALLLTMAVRHHILPSTYWADPARFKKERFESAMYIESLYPGAIQNKETASQKDENAMPVITNKMLKTIGLNGNFFKKEIDISLYEGQIGVPQNMTDQKEVYSLDPSDDMFKEKLLLIMDKINDFIEKEVDGEYIKIMARFPALDQSSKDYIRSTLAMQAQEYQELYNNLQSYLDKNFENLPWKEPEEAEPER